MATITDDINPDDDDEQRRANELARDYILHSPGYASIQESIRQITASLQPQLASMLQNTQLQNLYREALPRFDLSSYLKVANINYGQLPAIKRALDMVRPDLFQIPNINPFIANAGAWRDLIAEQQGSVIRDLASINTPAERLEAIRSLVDEIDADGLAAEREVAPVADAEALIEDAAPEFVKVIDFKDPKTRKLIVTATNIAIRLLILGVILANPAFITVAVTLFTLMAFSPKEIAGRGGDLVQKALDKYSPLDDEDEDNEEDTPSQ